jgi:hypothetical protein
VDRLQGNINQVRISDAALSPDQLLFAVPEPTAFVLLALAGVVGFFTRDSAGSNFPPTSNFPVNDAKRRGLLNFHGFDNSLVFPRIRSPRDRALELTFCQIRCQCGIWIRDYLY